MTLSLKFITLKPSRETARTINISGGNVSRSRRTKLYRDLTREEYSKIVHIGYKLDELFDKKKIEKNLAPLARLCIAGEFYFAVEQNPRYKPGNGRRKERSTDNYIIGVSKRPSELARHIAMRTHRKIVLATDLPHNLIANLSPTYVDMIVYRAIYDLVLLAVNTMDRQKEVWYDEALGIWCIRQSNVDEFIADRKFRRAIRQALKHDDRTYHGRNRSQSRQRGIPEGASISYA